MKMNLVALIVALALPLCLATSALADAQWVGGGGDDLWSNASNWDPNFVPVSATDRSDPPGPPENDANVARFPVNGTNTLIEAGIDAVAFGVQVGSPIGGTFGDQSASNTLTMTGGTLTTQGNFLFNVGRGINQDPSGNHLVQFNMSGGLVNAAGITIPEAFDGGTASQGMNTEMHVSGDSVVNTDLLRLGARDANSVLTMSDNAQVNLTDQNNGFANGQLWLESFEFDNMALDPDLSGVAGNSLLDIRDCAVLRIDGGVNNIQDDQARSLAIIENTLIPQGWITANGGADPVVVRLVGRSIYLAADASKIVPEPTSIALLLLSCPLMMARRRR